MPGCDDSCPGNDPTFEDWHKTSTTAFRRSSYLTSLLGRIHARVHHERRSQRNSPQLTVWFVRRVETQYEDLLKLPETCLLELLAAEVGHSESWREWTDGEARRDADLAYLKAWLQDAKSEMMVHRLAAHLRHAVMMEADKRLNCLRFSAMFSAMLTRYNQDRTQFIQLTCAQAIEIKFDLEAIEAKLAEDKAGLLEKTLQWDDKHDKLLQAGDPQEEEDIMQDELEALNREYQMTRRALKSEQRKLGEEAVALCAELRRVMPELSNESDV